MLSSAVAPLGGKTTDSAGVVGGAPPEPDEAVAVVEVPELVVVAEALPPVDEPVVALAPVAAASSPEQPAVNAGARTMISTIQARAGAMRVVITEPPWCAYARSLLRTVVPFWPTEVTSS